MKRPCCRNGDDDDGDAGDGNASGAKGEVYRSLEIQFRASLFPGASVFVVGSASGRSGLGTSSQKESFCLYGSLNIQAHRLEMTNEEQVKNSSPI
jgi:hypothetical protein